MKMPMILLAAAAVQPGGVGAAMADSAAAWNRGDLSAFVAVYTEDAVFVTAKGLVRGRAAIAARYAPSFRSGGNARGRLSFETLYQRPIDATHRLLIARWTLTAEDRSETGLTSLVFERQGRAWRIVSDHSS